LAGSIRIGGDVVSIEQDFETVASSIGEEDLNPLEYAEAKVALSRIEEVVEIARTVSAIWAVRPAAMRELEVASGSL
jgi:hypothetical protein